MEEEILCAVNDVLADYGEYDSVLKAIHDFGKVAVFDAWLRREGIIGYTEDILNVLEELECDFEA
ncbi:MAG: hypothetical protein IJ300_05780 [Clostridia bacterium]|nr:hypothetical protein [Clostridia bacterium]